MPAAGAGPGDAPLVVGRVVVPPAGAGPGDAPAVVLGDGPGDGAAVVSAGPGAAAVVASEGPGVGAGAAVVVSAASLGGPLGAPEGAALTMDVTVGPWDKEGAILAVIQVVTETQTEVEHTTAVDITGCRNSGRKSDSS